MNQQPQMYPNRLSMSGAQPPRPFSPGSAVSPLGSPMMYGMRPGPGSPSPYYGQPIAAPSVTQMAPGIGGMPYQQQQAGYAPPNYNRNSSHFAPNPAMAPGQPSPVAAFGNPAQQVAGYQPRLSLNQYNHAGNANNVRGPSGVANFPMAAPLPVPAQPPPHARQPSMVSNNDRKYNESEGVIQYNELVLGRVLGEGTFGIVYAGEFRSTPVAIKQLKVNSLSQKQLDEFMAEVKALREARNPHIVLFMGVSFNPYSIVTELLDTSLFNLLHTEKVKLTERQQLHVALSVARGVSSLHLQKPVVMHRDLKSLNVLCSRNLATVKICDLGLIKMRATAKVMANKKEAAGTPIWMAPEVLADLPYDEKCDVYSFSMVLFEIVTGTVPFAPEIPSQKELYQRVALSGERPRIPPTVRGRWSKLIQECWDTDPKLRPTMADVVKRLQTMFPEFNNR